MIGVSNNLLLGLRLKGGITQEELSERSGVSVRTIRNLERGQIQRPRRSSIELLLGVLDPSLKQVLQTKPAGRLGVPPDLAAEWQQLLQPTPAYWRGSTQTRTSLVDRERELDRLGNSVITNQVVVLTGPGGVGKTRLALAVAENVGVWFDDGVVVAEMGRIPGERHLDSQSIMAQAMYAVTTLLGQEPRPPGHKMLLVLDNTEHLLGTTALLVERLLNDYPECHLLVTSRRPPRLNGVSIFEVPPLSVEAAVDLLSQRLTTICPTLDLSDKLPQVAELCRELDGLPRLLEFAAHRLRMMSLPALLADSQARKRLGSADFAVLPHQRTLESSLHWSLDLLDNRHQSLLARLARRTDAGRLTVDDTGAEGNGPSDPDTEVVELLADLADASLLQVDRGRDYEYRMMRHIRSFLISTPELGRAALA